MIGAAARWVIDCYRPRRARYWLIGSLIGTAIGIVGRTLLYGDWR